MLNGRNACMVQKEVFRSSKFVLEIVHIMTAKV